MNKRITLALFERILFYSCLAVSLLAVILNTTNPTLDGPAHLYNAHNILYILSGNEFICHFFSLNKIPVANLTDHYLLALFMSLFSWQAAEKLLIVLYLSGFSILFRKLISQWNRANIGLSIFAIPFSFSFLYYIGFYNFCLSFPLLFGMLIYFQKHFAGTGSKPSKTNYFILCFIATLIYFTNGLTFMFAGLAMFLLALPTIYFDKKINFKKLLLSILVLLPGSICFIIFLLKVSIEANPGAVAFPELMRWIYVARPLAVFVSGEDKYTRYISLLIAFAMVTAIWIRVKKKSEFKFNKSDMFFLITIIAFSLFILVPDGASVGMMSIRLCYYFFIFLLIWVSLQQGSKIVTWLCYSVIIALHFTLLFKVHQPEILKLNAQVENIRNAGTIIKPNSIVLTADVTDNFMLFHFPDYLGIDKPLVIIGNYETNDGWFATKWNNYKMPRILLDGRDSVPPNLNIHWKASNETKNVDYVFIYGDYNNFQQRDDKKILNGILQKDYKLIYTSVDKHIHIFGLSAD